MTEYIDIIWWSASAGLATIVILNTFFIVRQQTAAVIERFGRFNRVCMPGLKIKIPLVEQVVERTSLRVRELDTKIETKTKDNVFVFVTVSAQYLVQPEKVWDAFYRLTNHREQMTSYIFDVIRARVPTINLDDVFGRKEEIAEAIKTELGEMMEAFGYTIVRALVTDIAPDAKVKEAMNEINAALRLRMAATEKGEAEKIIIIKAAEADARSKALQGQGIADQRKAIIEGLKASVKDFRAGVPGATPGDVMTLVLLTQYFDTLNDVAQASQTNTILIPHSPGGLSDIASQMRDAVFVGGKMAEPKTDGQGTSAPKEEVNKPSTSPEVLPEIDESKLEGLLEGAEIE